MRIELNPGEKIEVTLADTDGLFVIEYGDINHEKMEASFIKITADMPDNHGHDAGVIYFEQCEYDLSDKECAIIDNKDM